MTQVLFAGQENDSLREDVERTPLANEVALSNAPLAGAGYFKVPKVIER
jgi:aspartyl-tRNA(Asn)/glutamyl-tRNA(Gln) amidotransferase subunit C